MHASYGQLLFGELSQQERGGSHPGFHRHQWRPLGFIIGIRHQAGGLESGETGNQAQEGEPEERDGL